MNVLKNGIAVGLICYSLIACKHTQTVDEPLANSAVRFKDVSHDIGLITEPVWKYGGPTISDINNDGRYDFLLTNHDQTPVQLFLSQADGNYLKAPDIYQKSDLHGMAAGDYDLDGDNDILLSIGGGNGLFPKPQRLFRNDGDHFTDVTVESGISKMGARGRVVRWIDLDNDGDLDFMQVNAAKMVTEDSPRNILFENIGEGKFQYRHSPAFENMDAERILITDFNGDKRLDLIGATGYQKMSLWQGTADFEFKDVTEQWLPTTSNQYPHTLSMAHADIDNDGDLDYYFARGLLYYGLANNSVSFNKERGRLDLRDEGNTSHDGITLHANGDLTLSDFYHFPRAKRLERMPTFIGKSKTTIETADKSQVLLTQTQAAGFPESITETGWYIGYVGDKQWRVEWKLADNVAWDVRASFTGVSDFTPDWTPLDADIPDVLLINEGDHFRDASNALPKETQRNNWGVVVGDFNNDGFEDFFINRFGELKERIHDVLLTNNQGQDFTSELATTATTELGDDSHGDMGTAFDHNLDGRIDMLNGDDDHGRWHLYENISENTGHYALIHVGYSEKGTDPMGARITVKTARSQHFKLVGSSSASHSQSLLNTAHFGLGNAKRFDVRVEWRDGSSTTRENLNVDQRIVLGSTKH